MICPNCGTTCKGNTGFCTSCGTDLRSANVYRTPSVPQSYGVATPTHYVAATPAQGTVNSGNGQILAISILGIVAVAAIVFAICVGTGAFASESDESAATPVAAQTTAQVSAPAAQPAPVQQAAPTYVYQQPAQTTQTTSSTNSCGSYIISNSSTRVLSSADLAGYSSYELKLARNEIYARHGRQFVDSSLQSYFNAQSWYTPRYQADYFDANVSCFLNSTEQRNATTILEYEQSHGMAT